MLRRSIVSAALVGSLGLAGCHSQPCNFAGKPAAFGARALKIEYPQACDPISAAVEGAAAPRTLKDPGEQEMWDLTLQEAVQITLANSQVMRDLGGRVLSAPAALPSIYDPSRIESNPLIGTEAALSAYDAQLSTNIFWNRNERPVNFLLGPFVAALNQQDLASSVTQLNKTTASGSQFFLRNNTNYEFNNNPSNRFPSVWNTNIEAEFRQPLLQGAGVEFNRINGPNNGYNYFQASGVLIARLNTDVALADFEIAVRNLVSDAENAYWDLYFAYRDLDAKLVGRNSALATYGKIRAFADVGEKNGDAANLAQTREQYFRFAALVEDALSGRRVGNTATGGPGGAGSFAGTGGVLAREANLRFIMGLAQNDGRMIRPSEKPSLARVEYEWGNLLTDALTRRVELRRQKWLVKRRELELVAARNYLMPRLDATALYRWRGFGDNLWYASGNHAQFSNAVEDLTSGDFQEWQAGFQFNMPLGFRQGWAAVRNSELNLARERAVLETQELQVVHDLGAAIRELERAHRLTSTNANRLVASREEVQALTDKFDVGAITLDVVLDAQRRSSEAESEFYRTVVEYNLALKAVHYENGTLLEYNGVFLAEGAWDPKAYRDAAALAKRMVPRTLDYQMTKPSAFSHGTFSQEMPFHGAMAPELAEPRPPKDNNIDPSGIFETDPPPSVPVRPELPAEPAVVPAEVPAVPGPLGPAPALPPVRGADASEPTLPNFTRTAPAPVRKATKPAVKIATRGEQDAVEMEALEAAEAAVQGRKAVTPWDVLPVKAETTTSTIRLRSSAESE